MSKTPEEEEEKKRNSPLMNLPVLEEETEGKQNRIRNFRK